MNLPNKSLGKKPDIDERSGQESLHAHLIDKANEARLQYGPYWDFTRIQEMMKDPKCVRFPVEIRFDSNELQSGEFAYMKQRNESDPKQGFELYIHPHFEANDEALPLLIAYHIVVVNYGDIVDSHEAEIYGSTLMNMDQEEYYQAVCEYADQIPK